MSGSHMMLLASGGQVVSFAISIVGDNRVAPTPAAATFSVNADGSISYTGNLSSGSTSWISTPPPQRTYYVQIILNSGSAPSSGQSPGTIVDLTVNRAWGWTAASGTSTSANISLRIFADAAGTTLLASSTFNVLVQSNP